MMVHSALVLQHQRGKAGSPGHGFRAKPSHSICSFPCRGQHRWVKVRAHGCAVCAHVCLREWGHTSVQSPAADQLLTHRKD